MTTPAIRAALERLLRLLEPFDTSTLAIGDAITDALDALAAADADAAPGARPCDGCPEGGHGMSDTDFRAVLERLISAYDEHGGRWPQTMHDEDPLDDAVERARVALATEPERGPSDEQDQCWQWYAYDPEGGIEMYPDREQARSAAQSIMGTYQEAAHSDGWHEDMESVSWGMLVPFERAQIVARRSVEDSKWDEWVQYELRTARRGLPGALPVAIQTMTTTDPKQIMTRPIRADLAAEPLDPAGGGEALLAVAPLEGEDPTTEELNRLYREIYGLHSDVLGPMPRKFARAVLARWGRPADPA